MQMNMTMDMMKGAMSSSEMPMKGMDPAMMQECIEALSACAQACIMCADADAGEGMARCAGMCANCADVCDTMMRMMLRMSGMDAAVMSSMMQTTIMMCRACSAECMMHAEMSEHCRMCAMACDQAGFATIADLEGDAIRRVWHHDAFAGALHVGDPVAVHAIYGVLARGAERFSVAARAG